MVVIIYVYIPVDWLQTEHLRRYKVKLKAPRKHNNINNRITKKNNIQNMTQAQKQKHNKTAQQIQTYHIELKIIRSI